MKNIHQQIYHQLYSSLYAPKTKPGLLDGIMGQSIYLFHLFRVTQIKEYEELAETYIDQVFEILAKSKTPDNFISGKAGIGWGIEYLVQNNFVKGDANVILKDIDTKIFKALAHGFEFPLRLTDGIIGFGFYLISRIKGQLNSAGNDYNHLMFQAGYFGETMPALSVKTCHFER